MSSTIWAPEHEATDENKLKFQHLEDTPLRLSYFSPVFEGNLSPDELFLLCEDLKFIPSESNRDSCSPRLRASQRGESSDANRCCQTKGPPSSQIDRYPPTPTTTQTTTSHQ